MAGKNVCADSYDILGNCGNLKKKGKVMAKIAKKVNERFLKSVSKFQKVLQIANDRDVNESDTVSILTDIFSEVFGYDKYLEITREFAIRNTYCDLALVVDEKVQYLIEVKAIGIQLKDDHMRQALDYGANHGIEWIILTNGIEWKIYKIRFEKPINYDVVCSFNFMDLSARSDKDQELLFIIAKEGLVKNTRKEYLEKTQTLNRFIIGGLIFSEPVLNSIRKELRKLSDGMNVNVQDIENIIKNEVLKREIVEGDDAKTAMSRINRFYKKMNKEAQKKKVKEVSEVKEGDTVTEGEGKVLE